MRAAVPPPAISGGNLLVTHDGKFVVVADSDRDRLVVVDAPSKKVVADLALKAGDEPGRLVEDDAGRNQVALRRGGALVTLNLASLSIVDRRTVCQGPRGPRLRPRPQDRDRRLRRRAAGDHAQRQWAGYREPVHRARPT